MAVIKTTVNNSLDDCLLRWYRRVIPKTTSKTETKSKVIALQPITNGDAAAVRKKVLLFMFACYAAFIFWSQYGLVSYFSCLQKVYTDRKFRTLSWGRCSYSYGACTIKTKNRWGVIQLINIIVCRLKLLLCAYEVRLVTIKIYVLCCFTDVYEYTASYLTKKRNIYLSYQSSGIQKKNYKTFI